jgi:hypothetical protein
MLYKNTKIEYIVTREWCLPYIHAFSLDITLRVLEILLPEHRLISDNLSKQFTTQR